MKAGLVSIIIPTFNRANLLISALESLRKQTYTQWECIVIDDGSKQEEIEPVEKYIIQHEKIVFKKRFAHLKKGPSACRNIGLSMAEGEFIQFFDDDDIMFPQMLEMKVKEINKTFADVVVAPMNFYDVKRKEQVNQNHIFADQITENYLLGKISWYVSGPLWRRSFLSEVFDEEIQSLDDWDFNLRNIYKKPKMAFLQHPLQFYNIYSPGETLSSKGQLDDEEQMLSLYITYRKHFLFLKKKEVFKPDIHQFFLKKFVFLLRFFLVKKNSVKKEIFSLLKKEIGGLGQTTKFRVMLGYYFFKYLGMGYRFLKIK